MIPTYVSYRNTLDNMTKKLESVVKRPMEGRETEYYKKNIVNVHFIDDFMNDTNLYNYVTKAMGLEDMAFAKAMIRKVLTDDEFANKMTDKRYKQFATVTKELLNGKTGGSLSAEMQDIMSAYVQKNYTNLDEVGRPQNIVLYFDGMITDGAVSGTLNSLTYAQTIVANEALSAFIFTALGADDEVKQSSLNERVAWLQTNLSYEDLINSTTRSQLIANFINNDTSTAVQEVEEGYLRQSLEEQIGESNEGARLALYFSRTIGSMLENNSIDEDSWAYLILADKALVEVVYTALGISDAVKQSDVEVQKKLIEGRLSFEDLQDPEKLDKLMSRFSAMYDLENQVQYSPALMLLQSSSIQNSYGFSNDTMVAIQNLNRKSW